MSTFSQIIQRCVTRLGMVGGTGVQVYAEDILAEMVQARFDDMFESLWWEDYMATVITTLNADGTIVDDPVTDLELRKFTDIKYVYYDTDNDPLKLLPGRVNPVNFTTTGAHPRYLSPYYGAKVFRVMPPGNAGDSVSVVYRARPAPFLPDDEVKMDAQALIYGACYDYLSDDGSNPMAVEKMRNFYNERLQQLNSSRNEQDIHLMPSSSGIDGWYEE